MKETSEGEDWAPLAFRRYYFFYLIINGRNVNFNPLKNMLILEINKYSTYLLLKNKNKIALFSKHGIQKKFSKFLKVQKKSPKY